MDYHSGMMIANIIKGDNTETKYFPYYEKELSAPLQLLHAGARSGTKVIFKIYFNKEKGEMYAHKIFCKEDVDGRKDYKGTIRDWFVEESAGRILCADEILETKYGIDYPLDFQMTVPPELVGQNLEGRKVLFNILFNTIFFVIDARLV